MGLTKTNLFTAEQNNLADIAKVFAHPARIAILQYLLNANACINGDLVQELGLAQPTISQHLKELKNIGLITGTIEGVSMSYCIDAQRWNEIKELFNQMFDEYNSDKQDIDCC